MQEKSPLLWHTWEEQGCDGVCSALGQAGDAYTAYLAWKGTVFSEGDEGSRGAEQLPAQALADCLGSPSSALELLTLPMAWLEHRAGRGARLATATWAGTAALWAPFCPLESL